jgi:hypothetical protein
MRFCGGHRVGLWTPGVCAFLSSLAEGAGKSFKVAVKPSNDDLHVPIGHWVQRLLEFA